MSVETLRYTITLTLRAPILTQTSGAVGFGMDTAMRRDHRQRPCLPGTLVKGNLRHAWVQLLELTGTPDREWTERWLGKESPANSNDEPERGRLIFSEYWSDGAWEAGREAGKRFRISIDDATGAVAQGALQVIESPYPAGEPVAFTGHIAAEVMPEEKEELERLLAKGFGFIPAIGAMKGNGFGKIEDVEIMPIRLAPKSGRS